MPRDPARLTRSLLAAYRPGTPCAVAEGLAVGIPAKRPAGYLLHRRARAVEVVAPGAMAAPAPVRPGVAVIQIRGVMTHHEEWSSCGEAANYDEIGARFCAALCDPGVGSLLLDAETPGGDVPGIEELIERCLAAKAAAGKIVAGYVGALCASAGVWLLSALCDVIQVHPSARMGSVGVVIGHETDARKVAGEGIDRTIVRDPPGKANPNEGEVLDDLGRERLQSLVTETRARFVASVSASRRVTPEALLALNGAMLTGAAAVPMFADGLGSLDTTIALAASLAGYQEAA